MKLERVRHDGGGSDYDDDNDDLKGCSLQNVSFQ